MKIFFNYTKRQSDFLLKLVLLVAIIIITPSYGDYIINSEPGPEYPEGSFGSIAYPHIDFNCFFNKPGYYHIVVPTNPDGTGPPRYGDPGITYAGDLPRQGHPIVGGASGAGHGIYGGILIDENGNVVFTPNRSSSNNLINDDGISRTLTPEQEAYFKQEVTKKIDELNKQKGNCICKGGKKSRSGGSGGRGLQTGLPTLIYFGLLYGIYGPEAANQQMIDQWQQKIDDADKYFLGKDPEFNELSWWDQQMIIWGQTMQYVY